MEVKQKFYAYQKIHTLTTATREFSCDETVLLIENTSFSLAIEIVLEAPLQRIYDTLEVFKIMIGKYAGEIAETLITGKLVLF